MNNELFKLVSPSNSSLQSKGGVAVSFEELYDVDEWDVDMIHIAEQVSSPLVKVAMHIANKYSLHEVADVSRDVMIKYFHSVERGYLPVDEVPYHNAIHAADVTHMMHFFLSPADPANPIFLPKAMFASIVAAAAHDIGHPGFNNTWLVESGNDLAIQHNDFSCLERFHAAKCFQCALKTKGGNIFGGLSRGEYKSVRSSIIAMILATDNAMHADMLRAFTTTRQEVGVEAMLQNEQQLCLNMLLHTADIGNSSKQWDIYTKWTERLFQEFWKQGDMELEKFDKVSMAFFDRRNCNLAKCQVGFIQFFVLPLYEEVAKVFPVVAGAVVQTAKNKNQWVDKHEQEMLREQAEEESDEEDAGAVTTVDEGAIDDLVAKEK
jgi:hypothetical protein